MNRKTLTELFDLIVTDSKVKPPFLNMRKKEHKEIRNAITSCVIECTALIQPYCLKTQCINDVYTAFDSEWEWVETSVVDLIIYFKCEDYMEKLINNWIEVAIDYEEYESTENLNNFKIIFNQKRIMKNVSKD